MKTWSCSLMYTTDWSSSNSSSRRAVEVDYATGGGVSTVLVVHSAVTLRLILVV